MEPLRSTSESCRRSGSLRRALLRARRAASGARTLFPLAAFIALQGLSSGYYTVLVTIGGGSVVRVASAGRRPARSVERLAREPGRSLRVIVVAGLPYRAMPRARAGVVALARCACTTRRSCRATSSRHVPRTPLPHMRCWRSPRSGEQQFAGLAASPLRSLGRGRRSKETVISLLGLWASSCPWSRDPPRPFRIPGPFRSVAARSSGQHDS